MRDEDDELVSYWNVIHPPRMHPIECVPTPVARPEPKLPFCIRCGLPTRICNGTQHKNYTGPDSFHTVNREETALFMRLVSLLTQKEIANLREKLVGFRTRSDEDFKVIAAQKASLIREGKIPLSAWRLRLYTEFFYREREAEMEMSR
jgi:hypothetical protein